MKLRNKLILILSIGIIIGLIFGFSFGIYQGFNKCVSYGVHLSKSFINITFNEAKFAELLIKYQSKIEGII